MKPVFYWSSVAVGWLCLSGYLLLTPANSFSEKGILGWVLSLLGIAEWQEQLPIDKMIHFTIFFGLVFFWQRMVLSLPLSKKQYRFFILLNLVVWCCMGVAVEFLQEAMQWGRQFDYWDIMANATGCAAAWWLGKKLTPVETGVATKTNCL
ncbi:MAG: VanZ family protein [Sphingomonadales bacterium]